MNSLTANRLGSGAAVVLLLLTACSGGMNLNDPATQLNFGVKAAEMDLWREARFRFERAVELNPNDAMALNNLAVAYEGSGDFDRARLTYVRALKIDQGNQYIQKNYSRFMEFYNRNKKREASDPLRNAASPTAPAATPSAAPSPAPEGATPPTDAPAADPAPPPAPSPSPTGGSR
jgi:Tfp pilus assembly protein PilF